MHRTMKRLPGFIKQAITWPLVVALLLSSLNFPSSAEAAEPGTSTLSAGSAPSPASTTWESFQSDLFTGRGSTAYPLATPLGRQGVEPDLTLGYSSSSGNGWVGTGWLLDVGSIEISLKGGVPKYDGSDVFILNLGGMAAEFAAGTYGQYHLLNEGAFLRIRHISPYWEITDKSGTRYLFGMTEAAREQGGAVTCKWGLEKVIDVNGNTMTLTYTKHGNVLYPATILYTGHEPTGLAPANRVDFILEDRPDVARSLRTGLFEQSRSKRLARVEAWANVNGTMQRAASHRLEYIQSARTGRSLLHKITHYGSDNTSSMPPIVFTYTDQDQPQWQNTTTPGSGSQKGWNARWAKWSCRHDNVGNIGPYHWTACGAIPYCNPVVVTGSKTFSTNKVTSGYDDTGYWASTTTWSVVVSVGSDDQVSFSSNRDDQHVHVWKAVYLVSPKTVSFSHSGSWDVASLWIEDSSGLRGPFKPSFNNLSFKSGWSIIHIVGYNWNRSFSAGLTSPIFTMFDRVVPTIAAAPSLSGDVDGDGIADVVTYENGTWGVARGMTAGFTALQTWLTGFGDANFTPLVGDINNDGRADVILYNQKDGTWKFAVSTGSSFTPDAIPSFKWMSKSMPMIGDFNGDGISDICAYKDGNWYVRLGTETGFSSTTTMSLSMPQGAFVPAAKDVRWRVRAWHHSCQHDNYGCYFPDGPAICAMPSWTISNVGADNSPKDIAGAIAEVDANGRVYVNAGQDRYIWAETWLYVHEPKTIALKGVPGWDVACLYQKADGDYYKEVNFNKPTLRMLSLTKWEWQIPTNHIALPAGWTALSLTMYNENRSVSCGLEGVTALKDQVDVMSPVRIEANANTAKPLMGDFNGDGLTDVAILGSGQLHVALSNGRELVPQALWPTTISGDVMAADFNGDGLTDLASFDRSRGKLVVAFSTGAGLKPPVDMPYTISLRTADDRIQLGEFSGDGLPDLALFNINTGNSEFIRSSGVQPDLLKRIDNGMGGGTRIEYMSSANLPNQYLPFVMPVVKSVASFDGFGNEYVTEYQYLNGLYDAATREFRGFGHVEVIAADGSKTVAQFHQSGTLRGLEYQTEKWSHDGRLWSRREKTYDVVYPWEAQPRSFFPRLIQVDNFFYEGDSSVKQTRTRQTYDAYGNILATYADGDVSVLGDERYTLSAYAYNTTAWILNRAYRTRLYDGSGITSGSPQLASQTRLYYDGSTTLGAVPSKGHVTREEKWVNLPTSTYLTSTATYDTYGNPLTLKSADGSFVTMTYDTRARMYVTKTVNTLGFEELATYDPRFGVQTSKTDINGVNTSITIDAFGRPLASYVKNPANGQSVLLSDKQYNDTSFPRRERVRSYAVEGGGSPMTVYTFFDGLGREIQTRMPAKTDGMQIVSGRVLYDGMGRVVKAWNSAFAPLSYTYVPAPDNGLAPTEFFYEPGGRLAVTKFPDGSETRASFELWKTTVTDAKGNTSTIFLDAYGRTVRKNEVVGGQTFVTRYTYNATDNILTITDAAGNVFLNTYDSLGRKIQSSDPDTGTTMFAYDTGGRLASQTDARGIKKVYSYDNAGRIRRVEYQIPSGLGIPAQGAITYTYDAAGRGYSKGKLTDVSGPGYSASYHYDYMGRMVRDTKTIAGQTYAYNRTFDLRSRMLTVEYPNGDKVAYTYNAQDGVETATLQPTGGGSIPIVTSVSYNAASQITRMVYGNGVVSDYSFSPLTLHLERIETKMGTKKLQDLRYQRDKVGNITSIQDAVGMASQQFQYDALNRLIQATGAYGAFAYAYDAIGNITQKEGLTMTYGAGSAGPHAVTARSDGLTMTYDAVGNMATKDNAWERRRFQYDAENRLISLSNSVWTTLSPGWNLVSFPTVASNTPAASVLSGWGTTFRQLTRVDSDGGFSSFISNTNFNQFATINPGNGYWLNVSSSTGATLRVSGASVQLGARQLNQGWCALPGPAGIMKTGNWLGNLKAGEDYGQVLGYAGGKLVPVTDVFPGRAYLVQILRTCTWTPPAAGILGGEVRFAYDHEGARIQKISALGTHTFVGTMYEIAPDGKSTLHIQAAGKRVASKSSDGKIFYSHADHLGSVHVTTDQTGAVVETVEYEPYGRINSRSGSVDSPHKFTGQRLDPETGLYFYKARYYDADLGRFITPDLVIQSVGDSQSLNPYSYCRNNPVNYNDPSGHFFFALLGAIFYGAFFGAMVSAVMAAIMGGDIQKAMLNGAIAGAIGGAFGFWGAKWMNMDEVLTWKSFGKRALVNAAGDATKAAVKGESSSQVLKAAYQSLIISGANYAIGQFSGWSKSDEVSLRTDSTRSVSGEGRLGVAVYGIGANEQALSAAMTESHCRWGILNTSRGVMDVVECAQDIFFGPGTASIMTGRYLGEVGNMASEMGAQLTVVFHSQGTIIGAFGMLTMNTKLPAGTEVSFRNAAMPFVGERMASLSQGVSYTTSGAYHGRQMWDLVSAIGNPLFWPTALIALPFYIADGGFWAHNEGAWAPPRGL